MGPRGPRGPKVSVVMYKIFGNVSLKFSVFISR